MNEREPTERRRGGWRRRLHRIAKSHYTHLAAGVLLVLTAVMELVDGVLLDLEHKLDTHHALLVLGGVLVARSIADLLEGLEFLDEASEGHDRANPE